jgi:hypothetical protein
VADEMKYRHGKIDELVGCVLASIDGCEDGCEDIRFRLADGGVGSLQHLQDCCESVYIEDVCGDPNDLVGSPILLAEEVSGDEPEVDDRDNKGSYTWTFYKIATNKGAVTIRWYGTSNGFYSETADFVWHE